MFILWKRSPFALMSLFFNDILHCGAKMTKFETDPYFIFQRFECYTKLLVKELLSKKNLIFYFYFKCRNLHRYNRNKHIKYHNKTILGYNKNIQSFSYHQKEIV